MNTPVVNTLRPEEVEGSVERVEAAEVDDMGSFVGKKQEPRWRWPAIEHGTGKVVAYVFGRRRDAGFLPLKALLEPFGSTRFITDDWGAYARPLAPEAPIPGKRHTQQMEWTHLTLRPRSKRLARKTSCFSKSPELHDLVLGLCGNRPEVGLLV